MKDFEVIFKMDYVSTPTTAAMDSRVTTFYKRPMKARSFGEAERKFNKQTSNKFGKIKYRIITEIRLK